MSAEHADERRQRDGRLHRSLCEQGYSVSIRNGSQLTTASGLHFALCSGEVALHARRLARLEIFAAMRRRQRVGLAAARPKQEASRERLRRRRRALAVFAAREIFAKGPRRSTLSGKYG